jgi:rfaE bifunctional protein kinase chain/domain
VNGRGAPSAGRLLEILGAMAGQPVAMLVDMVADRFITGTPKRISREAPVLILRYDGETVTPGGGANAVANVAALGGRPLPLGVVGDDGAGDELLALFESRGIPTRGILRRTGYRTPTKTRILGGARNSIKQQIVRYDIEDTLELTQQEMAKLLAVLSSAAARAAVISDYGYGTVEPRLVPEIRRALGRETPILGDSRYRLDQLRGLDGATPNSEEAAALLGRSLDDDLEGGGRELLARLETRYLLITRGSAGMSLFLGERSVHVPVHGTDQVADVTGAGDTVIGTFALALAAGATAIEAACLANYAGGVVVMKMGTATLDPGELRSAIEHDPELLDSVRVDPE